MIETFSAGDRVEFWQGHMSARTYFGTVLYTADGGRWLAVKEDATGDVMFTRAKFAAR